jgi:hypothetical protein
VQPSVPARFEPPIGHDAVPREVDEIVPAALPPDMRTTPPAPPAARSRPGTLTTKQWTAEIPPKGSQEIERPPADEPSVPPPVQQPVISEREDARPVENSIEELRKTRFVTEAIAQTSHEMPSAVPSSSTPRRLHTRSALPPSNPSAVTKPRTRDQAVVPEVEASTEAAKQPQGWTNPTPVGPPTKNASAVKAREEKVRAEKVREENVREDAAAPTIRVHIGRIEVRAVMDAPRSKPQPAAPKPAATLALKDYLRTRSKDRR